LRIKKAEMFEDSYQAEVKWLWVIAVEGISESVGLSKLGIV